ncbi:hypothetical protein [Bradyrhizobium neotropicale]|uniref:hypothetical protein n=1 Tax=Bradyrhizobium neotropicale TaxID=1497615 RepID=UPI000B15FE5D|nr:hypothetical protein [Bradyrhizobium neotropicale]
MGQDKQEGCLWAFVFFLAVGGLLWLFGPKNEQELMDHARRTCERRGGIFYDKDLGNGVHQLCHDVR